MVREIERERERERDCYDKFKIGLHFKIDWDCVRAKQKSVKFRKRTLVNNFFIQCSFEISSLYWFA
jgi:hypothetical protein